MSKIDYTKTYVVERHFCSKQTMYTDSSESTNARSRQLPVSDSPIRRVAPRKLNFTAYSDSYIELEKTVTMSSRSNEQCSSRHESKWYKAWQYVDQHCLQYVYVFMVKVFLFDSWLLSRVSNIRKWMQQRCPNCPMVLWVTLLPLLILMVVYTVKKQNVISLDLLHDIPYDITETCGRIYYDFVNITTFESDFLVEYLTKLRNFPAYILPSVNVSLPEMPNIGIWCLLYIAKPFLADRESSFKAERCGNVEDFRTIAEKLHSRICRLDDQTTKQAISENDLEHESGVGANRNMGINVETGTCTDTNTGRVESSFVADDERFRKIVTDALRIYDADKTGRPDYALESAGGQIISTRCTESYDIITRAYKLLVFTFYYKNNNPRTVIQRNPIQPGACWAFQGFPGYLLIKLRSFIYVTGFTVEHAPKLILPNGKMESAPKKFNVWGFVDENDPLPVMFGDYEFAATDDNLQYFPVQNTTINTPYRFVELRVNSNHGHLEYTCLYRFRVHGRPV